MARPSRIHQKHVVLDGQSTIVLVDDRGKLIAGNDDKPIVIGAGGVGVAGPPGPQGPVGPQGPPGSGGSGGASPSIVTQLPANPTIGDEVYLLVAQQSGFPERFWHMRCYAAQTWAFLGGSPLWGWTDYQELSAVGSWAPFDEGPFSVNLPCVGQYRVEMNAMVGHDTPGSYVRLTLISPSSPQSDPMGPGDGMNLTYGVGPQASISRTVETFPISGPLSMQYMQTPNVGGVIGHANISVTPINLYTGVREG